METLLDAELEAAKEEGRQIARDFHVRTASRTHTSFNDVTENWIHDQIGPSAERSGVGLHYRENPGIRH